MKRTKWLAGAALALLVTGPLRADRDPMPLGELIGRAEGIVVGRVTETAAVGGGKYLMTVAVEETLKGVASERVQVFASSAEATQVRPLPAGAKVLAFLEPRTLRAVNGEQGVDVLGGDGSVRVASEIVQTVMAKEGVDVLGGDGSVRVASEIVQTVMAKGNALQLRDAVQYFGSREALPPGLVASLLDELSARVTPSADGAQLAQFACDRGVLPAVQLWAIERSGRLKIAAARPCLESLVGDPTNLGTRMAAAGALGDLKMAESVPVLLTLIAPIAGQVGEPTGNEDPVTVPRASDAEDASSPVADAEERGGGVAVDEPPGAPSTLPDGDNADEIPGADIVSRRADGGLSDVAVLALGKIGDPAAVRDLARVAAEGDDLGLHSTVVVALGLIGGEPVREPLTSISRSHPNALVRELAGQTLARLQTQQ